MSSACSQRPCRKELRATHGNHILPVRLNGMLHSDERTGMREIAEQLCRAGGDDFEFSRAADFTENVVFMREVLRVLEGGRRAVVFILEVGPGGQCSPHQRVPINSIDMGSKGLADIVRHVIGCHLV
jgi:hypothetical protein